MQVIHFIMLLKRIKYVPILLLAIQISARVFNFNLWPFVQYNMYTTTFCRNCDFYYFTAHTDNNEQPLFHSYINYPYIPITINYIAKKSYLTNDWETLDDVSAFYKSRMKSMYGIDYKAIKLYKTKEPLKLVLGQNPTVEQIYEKNF